MNLGEMAAFICGKGRKSDAGTLAKVKGFLRHRYQVVYNRSLWRDAIWGLEFTFTPELTSKPESWDGIKFMPNVVERVLAIRTSEQPLTAVADEHLFRSGMDEFAQEGQPVRFGTMAPVVGILPSAYGSTDVLVNTNDAGDADGVYRATIINTDGDREDVSVTSVAGSVLLHATVRVIERVTKPATTAAVDLFTVAGDETIATAAATATTFAARLPVRLYPIPTAATVFRALVKKKVIPLVNDEDVPELRTVEDAIIALAHGDLLQYERQYGKAQIMHQEGLAMIDDLETRHLFQEDQQQQIIPEVGEISGAVEWGIGGKSHW